jgi:hypothetical protein
MSPNIYVCAGLIAFGILFHFVLKLSELESKGQIITPLEYWKGKPYTSLTVVMAAYAFLALQYSINELTYTSAILTGIACNSLGDKLRARAEATLK